jgi:hypothetical protein
MGKEVWQWQQMGRRNHDRNRNRNGNRNDNRNDHGNVNGKEKGKGHSTSKSKGSDTQLRRHATPRHAPPARLTCSALNTSNNQYALVGHNANPTFAPM